MAKTPRELSCFGLSGLLDSKCRIHYSTLPNTRALGRASDLLVAKLKEINADELKVRALLLLTVLEAHDLQAKTQMIQVECGHDQEDIGIGVMFPASVDLEKLVQALTPFAERIVVRVQKSKHRYEVVSLFSLGKTGARSATVTRVDLDLGLKETPKAGEYTELGDLDYANLLQENSITVVKGTKAEPESEVVIKGSAPKEDDSEVVIQGASGDLADQRVTRIKSVFSKLLEPFKKKSSLDILDIKDAKRTAGSEVAPGSPEEAAGDSEQEGVAAVLLNEIKNGEFNRTLVRAQREVVEITKELRDQKARRWVDGFMGELLKEKSRLVESAQNLNQSVRQKELEFKTKELAMKEEIRVLNDEMRQKNNVLSRTRDQLNEAQLELQKLKGLEAAFTEDAKFKLKNANSQRLLQSAKQENAALQEKVNDLNKKLTQLQMVKKTPSGNVDMQALQQKYDRLAKQTEEFKRTNQNLLAKLNEKKERATAEGSAEASKRLEAAMKLAVQSKREAEVFRSVIQKLNEELAEYREKSKPDSGSDAA
jgi:hypothetical protein